MDTKIEKIKGFYRLVKEGCRELKDVMQYILAYGNYMNGQSCRGGSYGFRLKEIMNAGQIMSEEENEEGRMSFMLFIINKIEKDKGYQFGSMDQYIELSKYVGDISMKQLDDDIKEIKQNHKYVSDAIKSQISDDEHDKIQEYLMPLNQLLIQKLDHYKQEVNEL